jgi:hypothetical protein
VVSAGLAYREYTVGRILADDSEGVSVERERLERKQEAEASQAGEEQRQIRQERMRGWTMS